jgi:hypothetical protein
MRKHARIHWTHALLAQLGEVDDADIADSIGAQVAQISAKRHALAIAPTNTDRLNPQRWTLPMRRDLFKISREAFAIRNGLDFSQEEWRILKGSTRPVVRHWNRAGLALLGTMPDAQLAKRLGRSVKSIVHKRGLLGIPAILTSHHEIITFWTPERQALLGTRPDRQLALLWKKPYALVARRRWELGIPVFRRRLWTPEMLALLGHDPDRELATRFGFPREEVTRQRLKLQVPSVRAAVNHSRWTPERIHLLGTASDDALATRWGIQAERVRQKRLRLGIAAYFQPITWEQVDPLMGTVQDKEIAARLGVCTALVARRRQVLGIPSYKSQILSRRAAVAQRSKHLRARMDWDRIDPLLGTIRDADLAAQLGLNTATIKKRRTQLHIPSFVRARIAARASAMLPPAEPF